MRFSKAALAAIMAGLLAVSAAAQGDLLSGLQGAASGAVDTIGSAVGSAAGAVTGAVGSVTGAATTTEAPKEEKVHVYDSVADLVMRKKGNDTTVIAGLIEKLADMPEAADVVELLSSPNTTATVFIPRDEELTPEIQAELEALLAAEPATVLEVLKYHVVPDRAISTLADFVDGEQLMTLQGTPITVSIPAASATGKPNLITSSGQKIAVYQYNLQGGNAAVYTVKGLLRPGTGAAAPAPAMA